jgi:tetrapyrrole methylase family protein/MazG family protein
LLEEAYEVLDALESGSNEEICAELGDLLFHIVFLARLYEEADAFDIEDVVQKIVEKMIYRHPHVFGKVQVNGVEDVKDQWQKMKASELKNKPEKRTSLLDGIPKGLPVMMRAYRLLERAARAGYNRLNAEKNLENTDSALRALKDVLSRGEREEQADKLGDLLFAIMNLSRLIGVHPETALGIAISKFRSRFTFIEKKLAYQGRAMTSVSQEEMDALWKRRKNDL